MKSSAARAKSAPRNDRYFLRDLHLEIDFYDRKLAYLENFGDFASPADREQAEKGLRVKRAPLEKMALQLAASGVEFEEKDLPRSFRTRNPEPDPASVNRNRVRSSGKTAVARSSADDNSVQ